MSRRSLVFKDTDTFYDELKAALKSGDEIDIVTDYERYTDLPEKLKVIFELERAHSSKWVDLSTNAFIAGATAHSALNTKALVVFGAAAAGAGIGALGGPVGAAVGAVLGLAAGTVTAVLMDQAHQVFVEIDMRGKLKIKVRPVRPGNA